MKIFFLFPCSPILLLIAVLSACSRTTISFPRNAEPTERALAVELSEYTEDISWNNAGHVQSIRLVGDTFTDQLAAKVKRFRMISELQITAPISDVPIAGIADLKDLSALSLAWTKITDQSIEQLRRLPVLAVLDISHTAITDKSIDNLASMPKLSRLFIEDTSISREGMDELKKRMPNCNVQYSSAGGELLP